MRWFHHVRNDKHRITLYHVNALKCPKMCCLMKTIQESLSSTQLLKFLSSTLKKNEKKISNKHRRSTITVYFAELHLLFLYSGVDACIYSNAWIIEEYMLFNLVLVISTRHIQLWSQALPPVASISTTALSNSWKHQKCIYHIPSSISALLHVIWTRWDNNRKPGLHRPWG